VSGSGSGTSGGSGSSGSAGGNGRGGGRDDGDGPGDSGNGGNGGNGSGAGTGQRVAEGAGKTVTPEESVNVKDLKRLPDEYIKNLGGENYTQAIKSKTGGSKSNLYWNPQTGDVYTVPQNGGPPQHVDTIPTRGR
jgi:hypothetical protein